MPIPQAPKQLTCPKCGWKDPHIQRGDLIIKSHTVCPECGNKELKLIQSSTIEYYLNKILNTR